MIDPKQWFPNIELAIREGGIKTFPTKKAALHAASQYGWNSAVRVKRRFETIYIVGKISFQPSYKAGVELDTLRVPLLKWVDGVNPVVTFQKTTNNQ